MHELFGPKLWPENTRHPHRLMGRALLIAPILIGLVLTMFRIMVLAVSGIGGNELYDAGMAAFQNAMLVSFGFTATFGLVGIALLWVCSLRGAVVWAFLGGSLGAVASALAGSAQPAALGTAALFGWALFLTIRWQAGVKD